MPLSGSGTGESETFDQWQVEEIRKAMDEADRGEFAGNDEVERSLKRRIRLRLPRD